MVGIKCSPLFGIGLSDLPKTRGGGRLRQACSLTRDGRYRGQKLALNSSKATMAEAETEEAELTPFEDVF